MSSSYDAGYHADQALKSLKTKCPKSKGGRHKWKQFGVAPSHYEKCIHCKLTIYWK